MKALVLFALLGVLVSCGGGDDTGPRQAIEAVDGTTYPVDSATDKAPATFSTREGERVRVDVEVLFKLEPIQNGSRMVEGTLAVVVDGTAYATTRVTVAADSPATSMITETVSHTLNMPAGTHVAATRFRMTASAGVLNVDAIHFVRTRVTN